MSIPSLSSQEAVANPSPISGGATGADDSTTTAAAVGLGCVAVGALAGTMLWSTKQPASSAAASKPQPPATPQRTPSPARYPSDDRAETMGRFDTPKHTDADPATPQGSATPPSPAAQPPAPATSPQQDIRWAEHGAGFLSNLGDYREEQQGAYCGMHAVNAVLYQLDLGERLYDQESWNRTLVAQEQALSMQGCVGPRGWNTMHEVEALLEHRLGSAHAPKGYTNAANIREVNDALYLLLNLGHISKPQGTSDENRAHWVAFVRNKRDQQWRVIDSLGKGQNEYRKCYGNGDASDAYKEFVKSSSVPVANFIAIVSK